MFGGSRSYIIFNYLKYISINIIIFIGLIWLSQILRILELQKSITTQIYDVVSTTLLVLPSFINPLIPFLLIIAGFFLNYKFNSSNEIIILKQYFSLRNNFLLTIILTLGIVVFYFINNEYLSVNLYQKYKVKELEIRNNLKLG
ncbi:LptF/LptG family permease, partial [Alphaproteobacteria bacterium]|nr:LptF/LptG family permease [Alphaproteobacteria bacterium]